jgi:YfiH family protein
MAMAPGAATPVPPGPGPDPVALGAALVRFTGRADGDMADPTGDDPMVNQRRRGVVNRPWSVLRQVHGARVVEVIRPGSPTMPDEGDAAVSAVPGVALAVLTADCAPVALASPEGVIGVAHAGWRGLLGGVIPAAVGAMHALGASRVVAALGPCIHPGCYRFGPAELDQLSSRFGPDVAAVTADGNPAFDLPAAVRASLSQAGAELVFDAEVCTACSDRYWSWRARGDLERQATVVWLP